MNMEYVKIVAFVLFLIVEAYQLYIKMTGRKENKVMGIAHSIYQFVRKENLVGKILNDDRLTTALDLLQDALYADGKITLTPELKQKASIAFKGWHAEDKINALTADTVAVPAKKSED